MDVYKKGSKGDEIKKIQKRLKAKGFYNSVIDGDFGNKTLEAVRKFQKAEGLDVDGIVGKTTWNALFRKEVMTPSISVQDRSKAVYRIGSKSDEVKRVQERLKTGGLYKGPIDGNFGGGTESAVKRFQKAKGLKADGVVGSTTWKALFKKEISIPSIIDKPLDYKCLALTASFETGKGIPECFAGLNGDFDGQGMSFGVLQWNFGQNSLQPLLMEMINEHPKIIKEIFHINYNVLLKTLNSDKEKLMTFARSIQHPVKHYIYEPWKGIFKSLGRTEEFQNIQVRHANKLYRSALKLCSEYGLRFERAVALMFDIKVQNGSIQKRVRTQILKDFENLPAGLSKKKSEVQKMRIVANKRAEAANRRWIEDVRARKLCCANGRGVVHGIYYNLEEQYGIGLKQQLVD